MKNVKAGVMYRATPGHEDSEMFDCYSPVYTGEFWIVDCWICDSFGNIDPDVNILPVPIHVEKIGKLIGPMYGDEE